MKPIVVAIGLMTLLPIPALAVNQCKSAPSDATEVARNFRPCLVNNQYCASVPGIQVFGNAEGLLPKAGTGQTYYEARVGTDRAGAGGVRRLVFLIQGVKGNKATVVAQYFSGDHYRSFCKMS